MHKFLIKDAVGYERDFGNPSRAASFAQRTVGKRAVIAVSPDRKTSFWMLPEHAEYFAKLNGPFTVVNTASEILDNAKNQKATRDQSSKSAALASCGNKRIGLHPKFGEGAITGETATAYTVVFPSQKKPLRIAKSAILIIE